MIFIVHPLFDNLTHPTRLLGFLRVNSSVPNLVHRYKLEEAKDTPFYRFPLYPIKDFMEELTSPNASMVVKNLKVLIGYLFREGIEVKHLRVHDLDVLMNLWHLDYTPPSKFSDTMDIQKIIGTMRYYSASISESTLLKNEPFLGDQNLVLSACNHLDGYLVSFKPVGGAGGKVERTKMLKWFDPLSKTFRLRDIGGSSTISIPKEEREHFQTDAFKVLVDFDGFHLRIMDQLLNIDEIPTQEKAMDYLFGAQTKVVDRESFKKSVYQAIYSGHFNMVDHPWMEKVHDRMDRMKPILGLNTDKTIEKNIFNTMVQQYEVYYMSVLINAIAHRFPTKVSFHQYLYDGLYMSVGVEHVADLVEFIQTKSVDLYKTKEGKALRFPLSVSLRSDADSVERIFRTS